MTLPTPYRFGPRRGDVVAVRQLGGSRRLPDGLAEGDRVRLAGFDHGYWECEKDGRVFQIGMANIGAGGGHSISSEVSQASGSSPAGEVQAPSPSPTSAR